jgi:hypothetical protein
MSPVEASVSIDWLTTTGGVYGWRLLRQYFTLRFTWGVDVAGGDGGGGGQPRPEAMAYSSTGGA